MAEDIRLCGGGHTVMWRGEQESGGRAAAYRGGGERKGGGGEKKGGGGREKRLGGEEIKLGGGGHKVMWGRT